MGGNWKLALRTSYFSAYTCNKIFTLLKSMSSSGPVFAPMSFNPRSQNAKIMKKGQRIEGEITELSKIDDENYYVVETENGKTLVPAGNKPEYEKGDAIIAERTAKGFEIQQGRDYGL
jgi:hypothetical protein